MTRISNWKQNHDGVIVGGWGLLGPASAEVMSLSALDWVALDAQHGSFDDRSALEALHAIPRERMDVLVRVPRNDEGRIGRVLDAGARGVIVPMVETEEDARRAAQACRYPSQGTRSWGQVGSRWGRPEIDVATSNAEVVCAVMVESRTGLDNVDAIAATPGIDMIFVGPFDLSIALGTTVHDLLAQGRNGELGTIVAACERHNVIAGAFAGTVERSERLAELGFSALAAGTDEGMLAASSQALTGSLASEQVGSY
ncbi:HpcH/HpaI aldolase family protein [Paramicrobacterium chengjingii]|uniref:HpcH/HpaI aldolase/citrate lyase domain-containing protein n=1 Tax=Paramicrobacterium chengjingii TaxID=2769067 RepID=A0ABX6YHN4_9MICO|nr:aldolase/citrate lyase family protein [Microbacterium chengjingii]QPZ38321.1 hypothetical protein HCR76_16290 [Microbacterium chengjingii]